MGCIAAGNVQEIRVESSELRLVDNNRHHVVVLCSSASLLNRLRR
jgi:hypothetical protein